MSDDFIPFNSIGLCFSGGGYRATFFSLGVVSYLNKVQYQGKPLLDKVEAISTVSGGTLLGVAYAKAAQAADFDFDKFYNDFYNAFDPKNDVLLQTAVKNLEDDSVWEKYPYKKRSLINAFAITYSEMRLFEGDMNVFSGTEHSNLNHVCFNATDFSFGLAFRFQNTGRFGNSPLHNRELNKIKFDIPLGDIVASSSCFPLGFEPLLFPDDYFKDQESPDYKALKSLERFVDGIGIMDGGIADNQGIGSMVNISKQSKMKGRLNLIMVNDVGSFKMVPWEQDTSKISNKGSLKHSLRKILSYFSVKLLYWITLVLGILLLVINSLEIIKGQSWASLYVVGGIITGIGLLMTIFGIVTAVGKGFVTSWISGLFKKNVPASLQDEIISFENLSLSLIKRMLADRISSAVIMIQDVFLKQIRRLNYKLLYETKALEHKVTTSTVYELNGESTPYTVNFNFNENISPAPSEVLKSVGLTASETPTTLWWDKTDIAKNRMDTLIACGQFTTCYKLMDYILELKKAEIPVSVEIEEMYKQLEKDWKSFNENPLRMVH